MKKRTIPLSGDEDQLLRKLYKTWKIPRGQYRKHPDYLEKFTDMWNRLSGRRDSAADVIHYVDTQQKIKNRLPEPWPTFDGAYKTLDSPDDALTPAHTEVLCAIYAEHILPLGVGSDSLTYHEDLLALIAREFTASTGLHIVGIVLASYLEGIRKRGDLPRLRDFGAGFEDLDEIA